MKHNRICESIARAFELGLPASHRVASLSRKLVCTRVRRSITTKCQQQLSSTAIPQQLFSAWRRFAIVSSREPFCDFVKCVINTSFLLYTACNIFALVYQSNNSRVRALQCTRNCELDWIQFVPWMLLQKTCFWCAHSTTKTTPTTTTIQLVALSFFFICLVFRRFYDDVCVCVFAVCSEMCVFF